MENHKNYSNLKKTQLIELIKKRVYQDIQN